MNVRKPKKRIEHGELRELSEAVYEASKQGRPLTTMITVHPGRMESRPEDPGLFFRRVVRNHVEIWLKRRQVSWWAIWTRENYAGEGREHIHILNHLPGGLRAELEEAIARWWPGVDATQVEPARQPQKAFGYMTKQMTQQAQWITRPRQGGWPSIFREKSCRYTGAPVAAVLGKRCGVSNGLKKAVQERRSEAARLQAQAAVLAA